ncbi:MAG: hypothetical protein V3T49_06740 [Dehalococcoidia bacterium]
MILNLRSTANAAIIGIALIAALVLSACAGDDEPPTNSPSNSSNPASQSITSAATGNNEAAAEADLPTTLKKDPPAVAVYPKEVPEPGSMQENILEVFEQQVRAMNTLDYQSYLDTCMPGDRTPTAAQLKFAWDAVGGEFGFQIPDFSMDGYNARGVEFRIYAEDNVNTTFEIFDYDKWVADGVSRGWEKVDGEWYSTAMSCTGATGRQ